MYIKALRKQTIPISLNCRIVGNLSTTNSSIDEMSVGGIVGKWGCLGGMFTGITILNTLLYFSCDISNYPCSGGYLEGICMFSYIYSSPTLPQIPPTSPFVFLYDNSIFEIPLFTSECQCGLK
jgi:hypothetical protein